MRILFNMKRLLFFLLFLCACFSLPAIAKRLTQGFRLAKMELSFPHHPEWEVAPNSEINHLLTQPFTYLGKGAQCYVFESQDKNYVIKLFRYDRKHSHKKAIDLFNACKIAYDHLREETGLIYIHLNPTQMNLPILNCKDPLGRRRRFALDQARFVVQKKAKPFRETLQAAAKDPAEMKRRIDELISLLQTRAAKEIVNTDPTLNRNFGFLDDRAIEFDFGNYRPAPALNQKNEIKRFTSRLRIWLEKEAPEWVSYLDAEVERIQ